uniref:Uncharacterized protein n=1 Tax=Rhizophagus irregularis (strain DAOM 181602 / DAOM 197198 / MUCL 43194) TaxID=747089 RepID=U9U0F0_RHIID
MDWINKGHNSICQFRSVLYGGLYDIDTSFICNKVSKNRATSSTQIILRILV